jgi:hypothetical protein
VPTEPNNGCTVCGMANVADEFHPHALCLLGLEAVEAELENEREKVRRLDQARKDLIRERDGALGEVVSDGAVEAACAAAFVPPVSDDRRADMRAALEAATAHARSQLFASTQPAVPSEEGPGWMAHLFAEADRQRDILGKAYEEREKAGDSNEASLLNDFMGVLDDLFLRCGGTGELDNTQFVAPGNFVTDSKPCPGCPDCQPASPSPVEGGEGWPTFIVQRVEQDDPFRPYRYVITPGTKITDLVRQAPEGPRDGLALSGCTSAVSGSAYSRRRLLRGEGAVSGADKQARPACERCGGSETIPLESTPPMFGSTAGLLDHCPDCATKKQPADSGERSEGLLAAARHLLALKDGPRDDAYAIAKEPAWDRLRAAVAAAPAEPEAPATHPEGQE